MAMADERGKLSILSEKALVPVSMVILVGTAAFAWGKSSEGISSRMREFERAHDVFAQRDAALEQLLKESVTRQEWFDWVQLMKAKLPAEIGDRIPEPKRR